MSVAICIIYVLAVVWCVQSKALVETSYSIYVGGKIYTVYGDSWDQNPAEAMVVNDENGKIVYIGDNYNAERFYNGKLEQLSSFKTCCHIS